MEKKEQNRSGDVYRYVKVGAVFHAERGRERSELAPDVWSAILSHHVGISTLA